MLHAPISRSAPVAVGLPCLLWLLLVPIAGWAQSNTPEAADTDVLEQILEQTNQLEDLANEYYARIELGKNIARDLPGSRAAYCASEDPLQRAHCYGWIMGVASMTSLMDPPGCPDEDLEVLRNIFLSYIPRAATRDDLSEYGPFEWAGALSGILVREFPCRPASNP